MPYADRRDMATRFGAEEVGQFGDDADDAALLDASVEMDSYLGARYTLPLDAVTAASPLLVRICCDLARNLLWGDTASDRVIELTKDARKMLAALAQGSMVLPGSTGTKTDRADPGTAVARTRIFTNNALEGL